MWIAACTCGAGIVAESEAEAASVAETHLIRAAVPGPGETWQHSVRLGEAVKSCSLTPNWGGEAPARVAGSNGHTPVATKGSTMSPAEITKFLKRQELKFQEEDEEFEEPKAPVRKNPYTVDADPSVDMGFHGEGAYKEAKSGHVEDFSGWGGPGAPPEDDDFDYDFSIDPVDEPTRLDELPEGIIMNGQSGTAPAIKPDTVPDDEDIEAGSDYDVSDLKKPVWPGDKRG